MATTSTVSTPSNVSAGQLAARPPLRIKHVFCLSATTTTRIIDSLSLTVSIFQSAQPHACLSLLFDSLESLRAPLATGPRLTTV